MTTAISKKEPEFVYPTTSTQFPFFDVVERIVRALEARNWQVPGITVKFRVDGTGNGKRRSVESITGDDFQLKFRLSIYSSEVFCESLVIPGKHIEVYTEECSPSYWLYVGDDWEGDRDWFKTSWKMHSKLDGKPRKYLRYKGICRCDRVRLSGRLVEHSHTGSRPPLLAHNDDLGREYGLEAGDIESFKTDEVFEEFSHWLETELLPMITRFPEQELVDNFPPEAPIAFPEGLGTLFTYEHGRSIDRHMQAWSDGYDSLEPSDQFGLATYHEPLQRENFDSEDYYWKLLYNRSIAAGITADSELADVSSLNVPGESIWSDRPYGYFRITPNRANHVFVADYSVFRETLGQFRQIADAEEPKRYRLTDQEVDEAEKARNRTIIPITEYTPGSFTEPVVLFNRELDFEEVEMVEVTTRRR